jgi:hypothetical protein
MKERSLKIMVSKANDNVIEEIRKLDNSLIK